MKVITALKTRFAKVDGETLGQEIDRLSSELVSARNVVCRESVQAEITKSLGFEAERFERELAERIGMLREPGSLRPDYLAELAIHWAVSQPAFAAACAAAVAGDPRYSDETVAERDARVGELTREIAEHEAERERREFDREAELREVRLKAKLESIASKASGEDAA